MLWFSEFCLQCFASAYFHPRATYCGLKCFILTSLFMTLHKIETFNRQGICFKTIPDVRCYFEILLMYSVCSSTSHALKLFHILSPYKFRLQVLWSDKNPNISLLSRPGIRFFVGLGQNMI